MSKNFWIMIANMAMRIVMYFIKGTDDEADLREARERLAKVRNNNRRKKPNGTKPQEEV